MTITNPAADASPGALGLAQSPLPRPMSRWRVWVVYGALFAIVGGHLVDLVTQRPHWPFHSYPMWSVPISTWEMGDERLYGVTHEPAPQEILLEEPEYFAPLPSRFIKAHIRQGLSDRGRGKPDRLNTITGDYLKRYEDRRRAGLHDGPPLKGVKVYEFRWLMDKDASNVHAPTMIERYPNDQSKVPGTVDPGATPQEGSDVDTD